MSKNKNILINIKELPYGAIATWMVTICIVFSAGWFKYNTPISQVIIEIETLPFGKNLVDEKDVELQLMERFKTNFIGWTISELNPQIIEKEIESSPFIKRAHVYVDALNRLFINVVQREPVLRVQDINAMSFYIDSEGYRMPLSRHYTARVKVATGNIPTFKGQSLVQADSIYTALMDVSESISEDPFYEALVEQIYVEKNGDILLVPKIGNHIIVVGEAKDLGAKLGNLRIFMKEGLAYEGWQACNRIDLRFENQIVCDKNDSKYSLKTQ